MATGLHRKRDNRPIGIEEALKLLEESDVELSDSDSEIDFSEPVPEYATNPDSDDDFVEPDLLPQPVTAASQVQKREKKWMSKRFGMRGPPLAAELENQSDEPKGVLEAFLEYFSMDFWELVAEQTNLKSVQDSLHSLKTTAAEILHLTGMEIVMGTLKLPQAKMYWSRLLRLPLIADCMPRDRYFKLRNYLHFVNKLDQHNPQDKLWKVRPLISTFQNKLFTLPRTAHLSVDEQMIPFSGRCGVRQFVPSKPNPVGLKNFVLAANDGVVLDFCIYVGKGTVPENDLKQLGLGAAVVKLLCETVPKDFSHVIYTDRFFTGIKCAEYLLENSIYQTGTVMKNRIGLAASKLGDDKKLKRGEWEEVVREDGEISVVKWRDNKCVTLLSTCIGAEPVGTCKRWCKKENKKIDVPCPGIVEAYNKNMGGIDLCDRLLAYYRSSVRTRKWPVRTFNHFVDLAVVNCWLMYRRACKASAVAKNDQLPLIAYRMHLANSLIKFETSNVVSRSAVRLLQRDPSEEAETSSDEEYGPSQKKYRKVVSQPIQEVRYDNVGHLPEYCNDNFASKYRYPGCKSRSRVKCRKCNMYLCIMKNNCFLKYHTK